MKRLPTSSTLYPDRTSYQSIQTDTTPPTVTLTSPAPLAIVSGTVTLTADASDNVAVDHVDFLVAGSVVGAAATAPYSYDWKDRTSIRLNSSHSHISYAVSSL